MLSYLTLFPAFFLFNKIISYLKIWKGGRELKEKGKRRLGGMKTGKRRNNYNKVGLKERLRYYFFEEKLHLIKA